MNLNFMRPTKRIELAGAKIMKEIVMNNSLRKKMVTGMAAAGLAAALLASGCSTTVQSAPEAAKAVESGGPLPSSVAGFLGPDASKLAPGPKGGAALAWINPNAQWSSYTKIQLMPVEFWAAADSKVSQADQQTLTAYFYNQIQANLSKSFTLVNQPGPGVMTLRVALMDATTATPGLRSISVIVPQVKVINVAQSMVTGSYAFVGSAEAEMKMTDSVTGELLGEAVDQRAGGMGMKGAASFQWGDAQNAMDYWAQRAPNRILELQGKPAQS